MCRGDALRDVKSESQSAFVPAVRHEAIEDAGKQIFGYAGPLVDDFNPAPRFALVVLLGNEDADGRILE